jgi:hypothetical protein
MGKFYLVWTEARGGVNLLALHSVKEGFPRVFGGPDTRVT